MKTELVAVVLLALLGLTADAVSGTPMEDLKTYQAYFKQRFPHFTPEDYTRGMYSFNEDKRTQWEAIMEFPPYEMAVEEGQQAFERPFENGNHYSSCFDNAGIGIAQTYPRFDPEAGKVVTLGMAINGCRARNGEQALDVLKGPLVYIEAYMAETSRGRPIDVTIPDDPRALAAYEDGKRLYFTRRGPWAFACYHCHWEAAGATIRGNELSPAIGQAANFPAFRFEWGEMGSIQRRFKGCMENIGAKPLKPGGEAMANLEYFHRWLNQGLPLNAPNNRF